jgi:hypothetical protein
VAEEQRCCRWRGSFAEETQVGASAVTGKIADHHHQRQLSFLLVSSHPSLPLFIAFASVGLIVFVGRLLRFGQFPVLYGLSTHPGDAFPYPALISFPSALKTSDFRNNRRSTIDTYNLPRSAS